MIIKNGKIFDESGQFHEGCIAVENGKIKGVSYDKASKELCRNEELIEADGLYVIPGFVDIHFHGCVGYDFCDGSKEAFDAITKYQVENGVTSISPATMTLSREELARIFTEAGKYQNQAEEQY